MIERFKDSAKVQEALGEQFAVAHDAEISARLAAVAKVEEHQSGASIIQENRDDTDIFFIFAGSVSVKVHGREVAKRGAGKHFGEMAMIEPSATRSASVHATAVTVTARVTETEFSKIAQDHPKLWRRLAVELGTRLRERGSQVRSPNERAEVFICSSVEGLEIARGIQAACAHDPFLVRLWTDDVFKANKVPIESLMEAVPTMDFVIVIMSADDVTDSRGKESPAPRDNILFEMGLAVGNLGRERAFMLRRREDSGMKMPSDLLGVKALELNPGKDSDLLSRLGPALLEFRSVVKKIGPR